MARPRKFTDQQWAEALRLYVTDGPTAAAARTGVDKGNLTRRAKAMGLSTVVIASTREATEALTARRALKREQSIEQMCDFILAGCRMASGSHVIYVGQHKRPVTIKGLLPEEFLAVATGVATMSEALNVELGRTTNR
jgi:hypothetical protein